MRQLPILLREDAIADLEDIASYLVVQGAQDAIIHGFLRRIRQQCESIGLVPGSYPLRPDLGPEIRIAPFERSAVIAYRVTESAVEIINIFYGGRDYAALLGD